MRALRFGALVAGVMAVAYLAGTGLALLLFKRHIGRQP